jgi:hypothetical protein
MRRYSYVGPHDIRQKLVGATPGTEIRAASDLEPFATGEPLTFVVGVDGILRVADRHSEHVACAGGGEVLSAGELTAVRGKKRGCSIIDVSNQSTGYCPEPESWPAVAAALDGAGLAHPGCFTFEVVFRRCPKCGERNLVKDSWFSCAICGGDLPLSWNF